MEKLLIPYLLINLISFILYGLDKSKARKDKWRISENTLLIFAVLGIIGAVSGMAVFHHKTHKTKFRIAIPLIFFIEMLGFILWKFHA